MNPILSTSVASRALLPSYLKVGFMGFKEFGSGDGPLPQSPGFFLFSILSVAQAAQLYICKIHKSHMHYMAMICVISKMHKMSYRLLLH